MIEDDNRSRRVETAVRTAAVAAAIALPFAASCGSACSSVKPNFSKTDIVAPSLMNHEKIHHLQSR